jgi:microcompartment protein CcmL/EutN
VNAGIQAVCMVEFNRIAIGIQAADAMIKSARVTPLILKTICPGKFLAGFHGDVASTRTAMQVGTEVGGTAAVDHFLIPNISPQVLAALCCAVETSRGPAVGIIETFSAASCVTAADAAVKAAAVDLIEVRLAMGLGGKAICLFRGDVASVGAAADAGAAVAAQGGLLVQKVVIASMAPELFPYIL